jgi:hypothetical protein
MDKKKAAPTAAIAGASGRLHCLWRVVQPAQRSSPSLEIIASMSCRASLPSDVDDA